PDADVVIACGPNRMLAAAAERWPEAQVAVETYMGCGTGVCLGWGGPLKRGGYDGAGREGRSYGAAAIDWDARPWLSPYAGAEWDFPVLVNINGESVSEYAELTSRLDGVPGVAGFEINISCPNVEQGGMFFGNDPRAAATVTEAVRKRTKLPVWVKLTPMVSDIGVIARAVESAGADALCAINTFVGMSIDLNAYRPRLSFRTGGLSGPAIRPLAVHLA